MKKKGFTLIELLAVIVILAILALIAVPIVLKLVNNARKDSAVRSAENYLDGVKKAVMNDSMNTETEIDECTVQSDGNISCNDYPLAVDVDGKKPNSGTINFSNGTISDVTDLHFGKFWISGEANNLVAATKSTVENRAEGEYLVGDKITYKGERWYVIAKSSSSQEYVTLLKMFPLTKTEIDDNGLDSNGNNYVNLFSSDTNYRGVAVERNGYGVVSWYSSQNCYIGPNCVTEQVCNDTWGSCWDNTTCNDINDISACPTSYDGSNVKVILDNWAKNALDTDDLTSVGGYKVRLLNNNDVTKNLKYSTEQGTSSVAATGNAIYFATSKTPRWIRNNSYDAWMMNIDEDMKASAEFVANGGIASSYMYSVMGTIRPVINLKKTAISS